MQTPSTTIEPTTKEQFDKWEEVTRAFLKRNGIDTKDGFQALLGYQHLADQMDAIARKATKKAKVPTPVTAIELSESQQRAKTIMGTNFFGTQEAATHFGAKWNQEQLDALATVPFSDEVLEACKDTHVLVAGYPMTLLQVRTKAGKAKKGKLFYSTEGSWYEGQDFARKAKVEVRWYLIRKTSVENSTNKSWGNQQALLKPEEETPRACVVVYTIIGHFLNTGERLFERIYVRCSDVDSVGLRVDVGDFDAYGLRVDRVSDGFCRSVLGLSASRKLSEL